MKILKRGKPKKSKPVKNTCHDCGSVLLISETDCELTEDRGQDYWTCKCPCCRNTIWLRADCFA